MTDKPVTWAQGTAIASSMMALCLAGFMLLHSMILNDKSYASSELSQAVNRRNIQMDRMADMFENYRNANDKDHKEILLVLGSIKRELK